MSWILLDGERRKFVLALTAICMVVQSMIIPPQPAWGLTLSEEKEMGEKILAMIREQLPLVEDGEIFTYVQSVGDRIVKELGTTSYQYRFFVINDSTPNAFAVPGGYVFIYRGLIEMMETEGELAGILCHELAHIQARHIHRRMEDGKILSVATLAGMLAGVLLGMKGDPAAGQALAMGTVAGAASFQLKYSRENEAEADQLGFRYLCAAGYRPESMVTVMKKMNQGRWRTNSKIPSYLSTHPALGERIEYLQDMVQKQQGSTARPSSLASSGDFPIMQAALVAQYSEPQVALDRFQGGARKGDSVCIYGMGRLILRQGRVAEAIPYLQQAARLESSSPFVLSSLGAGYVQQGKYAEAQKVLRTALVLNPSSSIVHYRLAMVLQELGQKDEALQHLQQIEDLAPVYPEIDYQLGVLLGRANRLGLAHFHLGRYYEHRQDWKLAAFHFSKAKNMLKESPQKLEEVDRVLKELEEKKKEAGWGKRFGNVRGNEPGAPSPEFRMGSASGVRPQSVILTPTV